jgi:hypothetical protein
MRVFVAPADENISSTPLQVDRTWSSEMKGTKGAIAEHCFVDRVKLPLQVLVQNMELLRLTKRDLS